MARISADQIRKAQDKWNVLLNRHKGELVARTPALARESVMSAARREVFARHGLTDMFVELAAAEVGEQAANEALTAARAKREAIQAAITTRFTACSPRKDSQRYYDGRSPWTESVMNPLAQAIDAEAEKLMADPRVHAITRLQEQIEATLAGGSVSGEVMELLGKQVAEIIAVAP